MHLATTTEDTGLSESSYEFISGVGDDIESQDDNYTESISESVGSLDFHRPDDVHSLAGTEQTYDDDSVADEGELLPSQPRMDNDNDNDNGDGDGEEEDEVIEEEEEEEDDCNEDTIMAESHRSVQSEDDPVSEAEAEERSRSSLEYTHQSLGTPSIFTPEASRIVERPVDNTKRQKANFWEAASRTREYITEAALAAIPGFMLAVALALLVPILYSPATNISVPPMTSTTEAIIQTTTASFTSVAHTETASVHPNPPSTGGMGLIPIGDAESDEWLFGPKKPAMSFTSQAPNNILIHVAQEVKDTWLAKDCLSVAATRSEHHVDATTSLVDEGILLKFPRKEAHGIVNLLVKATCRPRIHKVVKVHFGKGIMEEAYERTKHLAHDLSILVPAAAQEAERCIEEAKRSLGSVSDAVGQNIHSASESVVKTLDTTFPGARQYLEECTGQFSKVQDLQNHLRLRLLDAQISANMWWLKTTGRQAERDEYRRKAKEFMAQKHAAAEEASRARKSQDEPTGPTIRSWSKILRQGRCQKTAGQKGRGMHLCKAAT